MFTGLVQAVGRVMEVRESATGVRLVVDTMGWEHVPAREASIAVNGCCLTVANHPHEEGGKGGVAFDVIHETLSKTSLGALKPGSRVNLEHALTPQTLMGGHIVQGHVDGLGDVVHVQTGADYRIRITPRPPRDMRGSGGGGGDWRLMQYVVPKGSICIDGVSLTLAAVDPGGPSPDAPGWFEVALIPTTLERTTLGDLAPGSAVNLEVDMVAKTVVHWLRHFGPAAAGSFPVTPPIPPGAAD